MNKQEYQLIGKITERAYNELNMRQSRLTTLMDLENTHETTPLKLQALLEADYYNFAHDIYGIVTHIDRETKTLTDCFIPRFAL